MSAEITLTSANFEAEVLKSTTPVLVDFWAEWCMPCKMIAPVVEQLASAYAGRLKVGKINVDQENELAAQVQRLQLCMAEVRHVKELTLATGQAQRLPSPVGEGANKAFAVDLERLAEGLRLLRGEFLVEAQRSQAGDQQIRTEVAQFIAALSLGMQSKLVKQMNNTDALWAPNSAF